MYKFKSNTFLNGPITLGYIVIKDFYPKVSIFYEIFAKRINDR